MTSVEYYRDGTRAVLYHGDALAVLPTLADASVHAVITDPPYSSGGQYRGDRAQPVHTKYVNMDFGGAGLPMFSGDNRDQRSYVYWCALWLGECLRVAAPGAVCAVFCDWRQLPVTTDALQAGGWVWRGVLPWHKPNGRNTAGRFANNCEYVVWGTAGPRDGAASETLGGFVQANVDHDRDVITQKPLPVMRHLVRIVKPGQLILDPFTGSGTTGVAALVEGRRFVGVERDEGTCATAAGRLGQAALKPSSRDHQDSLPLSDVEASR